MYIYIYIYIYITLYMVFDHFEEVRILKGRGGVGESSLEKISRKPRKY